MLPPLTFTRFIIYLCFAIETSLQFPVHRQRQKGLLKGNHSTMYGTPWYNLLVKPFCIKSTSLPAYILIRNSFVKKLYWRHNLIHFFSFFFFFFDVVLHKKRLSSAIWHYSRPHFYSVGEPSQSKMSANAEWGAIFIGNHISWICYFVWHWGHTVQPIAAAERKQICR